MATTSFAVGSVSVAIVWGTFFYPPPPERSVKRAIAVPAMVEQPESVPRAAVRLATHTMPTLQPAVMSNLPASPALVIDSSERLAIKP